MKNLILGIVGTIVLGVILHQFLPWWSIVIAAGGVGLIFSESVAVSFIYGFLGGLFLWGVTAFFLDIDNGSILSRKMGEIFGGIGSIGMICATALLGGILGGFSAMTGTLGRKLFE